MQYLPLLGILIVIIGFALKWNPIGIVVLAMFVTGLAGGLNILNILDAIGGSFVSNRNMATYLVILPVVGLLEKNGLKETAAKFISKIKNATPGVVIMSYGLFRTFLAAFNVSVGGVAGFVRPIVFPMAVASVENKGVKISETDSEEIKGMTSSVENVTWFFGQALFVGGSGLLLVQSTLKTAGYELDPIKAVAAEIPVMIFAIIISFSYYTYKSKKIMKKYVNSNSNIKK